jgi:hypothetical protein
LSPHLLKPGMTVYSIFGSKTDNPRSIPVEVLRVQKVGAGFRVIYRKNWGWQNSEYDTAGLQYFCRNHQLEPL